MGGGRPRGPRVGRGRGGPAARAGEIVADPAPCVLPIAVRSVPGGEPIALDRAPVLLTSRFSPPGAARVSTNCRSSRTGRRGGGRKAIASCSSRSRPPVDRETRGVPRGGAASGPPRLGCRRVGRPGARVEAIPAHVLVDANGRWCSRRSVADLSADQMERLIAPRSSERAGDDAAASPGRRAVRRGVGRARSVRRVGARRRRSSRSDPACVHPDRDHRDGTWLPPTPSSAILAGTAPRVETVADGDGAGRVVAMPGRALRRRGRRGRRRTPVDVVFSVVHGWGGEDGRVQGLLDVAGIPYVGAGVLGSAAGMDKWIAKEVFAARGIPVTPWLGVSRDAWPRDAAALTPRIEGALGYPVFVKPANGGSSVGISKVGAPRDLEAALDRAFLLDRRVIVERGVEARRSRSRFWETPPRQLPLPERSSRRASSTTTPRSTKTGLAVAHPAPIPPLTAARVRTLAVEAFRALDLAAWPASISSSTGARAISSSTRSTHCRLHAHQHVP